MANSAERALQRLNLTGSASQVTKRWNRWRRSYEYYIEGKGITQVGRKKSQLLHLVGIKVQDLYEDLVDPGPTASTDDVYSVCIWKLNAHFQAKDNVPYERHVFRHMAPGAGETADKLLVHLRKQARNCNFGESLEENVRDQLNEKLPDIEWKKKLLEVKDNTLKDAMEKVRLWESAFEQASQMVNLSRETSVGTNAVGTNRGNNKTCFNRGSEGHFGRDRRCPANGRKCGKCGRFGHFALCCKEGKSGFKPSKPNKQHKRQQHYDRRQNFRGRQANFVEGDIVQPGVDDSFTFIIEDQTCALSTASEPVITMKIGGISKEVLIDSGSASNLEISQGDFKELEQKGLKVALQPSNKKLYGYGGQGLVVVERFTSELLGDNAKVSAQFTVVKKGRCLLGYSTAIDLGVLHVGAAPTPVA